MSGPTVCVKALRPPFFTAAARTGQPIPDLCAALGVPHALLSDLGARVPHATVVRVWDALAARCDDPGFGLGAAVLIGAPRLDLVDHVIDHAPTLRAFTESFLRYQRLFHDANDAQAVEEGEELLLRHRFAGDLPRSRHFVEFIMGMWVARVRPRVRPGTARVCLRGPPAVDRARYEAALGPAIDFGAPFDGIVLPRAALDEPLAAGDPAAAEAFAATLDQELCRLQAGSFPDTVRAQVIALMRAGSADAFDLAAVARRLKVSTRTLQRRLLAEGQSFRAVIDAARREVALSELGRGASTVTDLAFLLGFSEHSAFSRAFRRWTGKSPAAHLRALAG